MKKITAFFLILTLLITTGTFVNAHTNSLENSDYTIDEIFVSNNEFQITSSTSLASANTKTYSINWTIAPNQTLIGTNSHLLAVGDTVSFNLTCSSSSSDIKIGLLTPTNSFRYFNLTNGSLYSSMIINCDGIHKFRVKNESNASVTLTGTYTIPITYGTKWFSQVGSNYGTTWNSTNLDNLYFPNMASCSDCESVYKCANTPLYTTTAYSPAPNQLIKGHINYWGCSISSMAMVLRNMGATVSNKYDIRTGTTGNLDADPFTVTMANISWPEITLGSNNHYEITSYTSESSPMVANWYTIASSFGKTAYEVNLTNKNNLEKADILAYHVKANPEGIVVRTSGHTLVFTQTTHEISEDSLLYARLPAPIEITQSNEVAIALAEFADMQNAYSVRAVSSTEYDSEFICYDPGTSQSALGNGVIFSNSYTARNIGGIDRITKIYYID